MIVPTVWSPFLHFCCFPNSLGGQCYNMTALSEAQPVSIIPMATLSNRVKSKPVTLPASSTSPSPFLHCLHAVARIALLTNAMPHFTAESLTLLMKTFFLLFLQFFSECKMVPQVPSHDCLVILWKTSCLKGY